ncbi:MAG: hypothetical protein HZA93_18660 [Verrucomicrobia bacterium]|nr:hypothetical protein [Verrucomicrobiota bacterium]
MKIIFVLLVLIGGAFWFFHGRSPQSPATSAVREAAAKAASEIAAQAKAVQATAPPLFSAVKREVVGAQERILAGEKIREQTRSFSPPARPAATTPYERILRGERFIENRQLAAR